MIQSLSGLESADLAEVVDASEGEAIELRNARILVTGATGWFGTWLLDALVALDRAWSLNLRIVALTRDPVRFAGRFPRLAAAPSIEWVAADVRDGGLTIAGDLSHVVHAATESSTTLTGASRDTMHATIVDGTRNVIRVAREAGARRFLYISSGAVYGGRSSGPPPVGESAFDPGDHAQTGDAYADGKRDAERLVSRASVHGFEVVVARCFTFVGPHMPLDAHFAIGNFIEDIARRRDVHVRGDGKPLRSYLCMSDLVRWLFRLLVAGRDGAAYNVGSPEGLSIAAVARRCARCVAPAATVRIDYESSVAGRDYVPDTGRAAKELALDVRVGIDDAIARTLRWALASTASMHEKPAALRW